jgi:hypothetical protein
MQREKTALEYFVTNIFLLQKLLFRNPSGSRPSLIQNKKKIFSKIKKLLTKIIYR